MVWILELVIRVHLMWVLGNTVLAVQVNKGKILMETWQNLKAAEYNIRVSDILSDFKWPVTTHIG